MFHNPTPKAKEEQPPIFNYPIIDTIKLPFPTQLKTADFFDVLANRKSKRTFSRLEIDDISNILYFSAKTKNIAIKDNGYIVSHRPSPSAGAIHPIDILILTSRIDRVKSFYYYNAFQHSINKLKLSESLTGEFIKHLNSVVEIGEGTLFWFIAHESRTAAKYENSMSLIWRDAGALIQCIQMVCTALDLNSCGVGTLAEPFVTNMFLEYGCISSCGGIIVG